jgi:acyl-CoA synthetase (AMP-forming)/AMP-acid ligase II
VLLVSDELRPMVAAAHLPGVEVLSIESLLREQTHRCDPHRPMVDVPDDFPLEIRYTSGTTGRPKGVVQTHGTYTGLTRGMLGHLGLTVEDSVLYSGALSHGFAGGWSPVFLAAGCRQFIHSGFEPVTMIEQIREHGITTLMGVPTMLSALFDAIEEQQADVSSLRTVFYGGGPMSPDRLRRGLDLLGPVFMQSYGSSEVIGGMTVLDKDDHVAGGELLASCGRPSHVGEVIVADDDGTEVPAGEVGEILMRGPTRLAEYWNRPEETAAALTADGWFRTGDIARMDERGYLYIVDRKGDMIKSGGYSIAPLEIENALSGHPAVAEVAVVSVPHEKWGEAVHAVVRLRVAREVDRAELISWARDRLAGYKVPKSIDFTTGELPRNLMGKLLRRTIREPYWSRPATGPASTT